MKIQINRERGVFRYDEEGQIKDYPILEGSKRKNLIVELYNNDARGASDLCRTLSYNDAPLLCREINEVNKRFREGLEVENDLIVHLPAGGYKLNWDMFDIELKP